MTALQILHSLNTGLNVIHSAKAAFESIGATISETEATAIRERLAEARAESAAAFDAADAALERAAAR